MNIEKLSEKGFENFIDENLIFSLLEKNINPDKSRVREIIDKSLNKNRLSLEETAVLLNVEDPELLEEIYQGARDLKERVYGNRIVLFAPLYIGNKCTNDCQYCGFKISNKEVPRMTLTEEEIKEEIIALENVGHKRLILVFGEHPAYDADFIAKCVNIAYTTKKGNGEIRRVNINAAPLDIDGYKKLKKVGIGTYQIFQETYHQDTYKAMHPKGLKSNYLWRLSGLDRAMEGDVDDVGLGVLFGLFDWKFEVLGLLSHTIHLEEKYGVGPHTISFPRIQEATNIKIDNKYLVNDRDFKKLIAIIRLAVPYTGLILTARERAELRNEIIKFGVSQIDAGSRIELRGYTHAKEEQELDREQFRLGDIRSLDEIVFELAKEGFIPSWCTACYRLGRTGEHFMEFSIPGFIKRFCTPNAICTFKEYLVDYASEKTKEMGEKLILEELAKIEDEKMKKEIIKRLEMIEKEAKRDLYF